MSYISIGYGAPEADSSEIAYAMITVENNGIALGRRASLPTVNNFAINELMAMPPFWGWVDCEPKQGLKFQMLLGGADDGVALRFFWNGGYERKTLELWTDLASKSDWTVDIGAHTGVYSLAALSANDSGRVISFEPHFMNFSRLNLNLRSNGFRTAYAWMLGVGARNEVLPFRINTSIDYLSTGGSIGSSPKALNTNIQVVSLDSFLPDEVKSRVSLVKMDVEGHEAMCLRGMRALINRVGPDIFFECIEKSSGQLVQDMLRPLGYCFFEIDDQAKSVIETEVVAPRYDASGAVMMSRLNRIATKRNIDFFRRVGTN